MAQEYPQGFLDWFEAKYGPAPATSGGAGATAPSAAPSGDPAQAEPQGKPWGWTPEFQRWFEAKYGPTAGDYASQAGRSFARGLGAATGALLEAPSQAAGLAARALLPAGAQRVTEAIRTHPLANPLGTLGRLTTQGAESIQDVPEVQHGPNRAARFLAGPMMEGVGSSVPAIAGALAAGPLGLGARGAAMISGTTGVLTNAEMARAEAQRMGASVGQEAGAAAVGGVLGTLESVQPTMLTAWLERAGGRTLVQKFLRYMAEVGTEAGTEFTTEGIQQLGQDLYAKGTFDPERDLAGWQEAASAGGAAGAFVSALVGGAVGAKRNLEARARQMQAGEAIARRVLARENPQPSTFYPGLTAPTPGPENVLAGAGAESAPVPTTTAATLGAGGGGGNAVSPKAAELAQRVLDHNVARGGLPAAARARAAVGGPQTDGERSLDDATRSLGFEPAWIDAGVPLRISAATNDRAMVFDRRAEPAKRLTALVVHEWTHGLRAMGGVQRENWNRYRDRLKASVPELYAASEKWAKTERGEMGIDLTPDQVENEAVGTATESLNGFLLFTFSNPEAAVRLATDNPNLFVSATRALVRAVNRIFGSDFATQHMADAEALADELEGSFATHNPGMVASGLTNKAGLRAALAFRDMIEASKGLAVQLEGTGATTGGSGTPEPGSMAPVPVAPPAAPVAAPAPPLQKVNPTPPAAPSTPPAVVSAFPVTNESEKEDTPLPPPIEVEIPASTPARTTEAPPPVGQEGAVTSTPSEPEKVLLIPTRDGVLVQPVDKDGKPKGDPYYAGEETKKPVEPPKDLPKGHIAFRDNTGDPAGAVESFLANPVEGGAARATRRELAKAIRKQNPDVDEKQIDEAIEAGFVRYARRRIAFLRGSESPAAIYRYLVSLYNAMPTLNQRTSTSRREQAYSTPLPLAWLASELAGVTPTTEVYEPTAGNGALLIGADPEYITANELNRARYDELSRQLGEGNGGLTSMDATHLHRSAAKIADAVLANPPFGRVYDAQGNVVNFTNATPEGQGLETALIDQQIALNALAAMKDGGRAVLIMGSASPIGDQDVKRRAHYNALEQRKFWKTLYDGYNVVDHFTVAGKMYDRQGAGWPVDVVVIHGRGKSAMKLPGGAVPRVYESWDELQGVLDAVGAEGSRPVPVRGGTEPGAQDAGGATGVETAPGGSGAENGGRGPGPAGNDSGAGDGEGDRKQPRVRKPRAPRGGSRSGAEPVAGHGTDVAGGAPVQGGQDEGAAPEPRRPEPVDRPSNGPNDDLGVPSEEDVQKMLEEELGLTAAPSPAPTQAPAPDSAQRALDAARELEDMFAVEPLDEEKYQAMKPRLQVILEHVKGSLADVRAIVKAIATYVRDVAHWADEKIKKALPYLARFATETVRDAKKQEAAESSPTSEYQASYTPVSKSTPIGTLVPVNMRDATRRALTRLQERVGNLDEFVAKELGYKLEEVIGSGEKRGYFAGEQVDALALAIDNVKNNAGFVLADQTGVGKGRVVAAMLRYAHRNGKVPVFFTAKPGLYVDMLRDLRDIGSPELVPFLTNRDLTGKKALSLQSLGLPPDAKLKSETGSKYDAGLEQMAKTGRLPEGRHILFSTYSQVAFSKGKAYPRHHALRALAPNAMFILDESHLAGGPAAGEEKGRGKKVTTPWGTEAKVSHFIRELISGAQGVVYSSATWAKSPNVMSLYSKTDVGIMAKAYGMNEDALAAAFREGGVPFQQIVSNLLVESGQLIRRERDFTGIEIPPVMVEADVSVADTFSKTTRDLFLLDLGVEAEGLDGMSKARKEYIKSLAGEGTVGGAEVSIGDVGSAGTGFASVMHNLISQALLGMKTKAAVKAAIDAHARGEKPIIALANTMGSALEDFAEFMELNPGDLVGEFNFNRLFLRYHEKMRVVTLKDARGESKKYTMTDQDILTHGGAELLDRYRAIEEQIRATDMSEIIASPIDYILNELRAKGIRTEEITGRSLTIDGKGRLQERQDNANLRNASMNGYNNGGVDALVINQSASTGFSLHASEKVKDQRQRHMVILQAQPDINEFMQILGRINRTGQVKLPLYSLLVTNLPAELRPVANLMRKMAQLNANTTSKRSGALDIANAVDFMNQYGDEIVARILRGEPAIAEYLDVDPTDLDEIDGIAGKATGRLPMLSTSEQERILGMIEAQYKQYIEELDATGQNMLEAKVLDLDARTMESKELIPRVHGSTSPLLGAVDVSKLDVKRVPRPPTWEGVQEAVKPRDAAEVDGWIEEARQEGRKAVLELQKRAAEYDEEAKVGATEAKRKEAEKMAARARRRMDDMNSAYVDLARLLPQLRPEKGVGVMLSYKGDEIPAVVSELVRHGKTKSLLALSDYQISVYSPEFRGRVRVSLSAFQSSDADPTWALRSNRGLAKVKARFDEEALVAREERFVMTGNIAAGFMKSPKGQFVIYTDDKGKLTQGLLMPVGADPERDIERQPIKLTMEQAVKFLRAEGSAHEVWGDNGNIRILGQNGTILAVKTSAPRPYYTAPTVTEALGQDLIAKRGDSFNKAKIAEGRLRPVMRAYENMGVEWSAPLDRNRARKLVGQPERRSYQGQDGGELKPTNYAIAPNAQGFYSQLARVLDAKLPEKGATAKQVLDVARKFAKAEELEWSGLTQWINSKGSATKAEVIDFLEGNDLQVTEVVRDGGPGLYEEWGDVNLNEIDRERVPGTTIVLETDDETGEETEQEVESDDPDLATTRVTIEASATGNTYTVEGSRFNRTFGDLGQWSVLDSDGQWIGDFATEYSATEAIIRHEYDFGAGVEEKATIYSDPDYNMPGGEGYTELLLTLPTGTGERDFAAPYENNKYLGPHWSEPNVVAHVRYDTREVTWEIAQSGTASANMTTSAMMIQEVQSDWHQTGRTHGYIGEEPAIKEVSKSSGMWYRAPGGGPWYSTPELARAAALKEQVPAAPFKTSWGELALKRMLRLAAEKGLGAVAWTRGITQVERYQKATRKVVDSIHVSGPYNRGGLGVIEGTRDGHLVFLAKPNEDGSYTVSGHDVSLEDLLGKQMAETVRAKPNEEHTFEGDELAIGGRGMQAFYDEHLVNAANKLGKRFGMKVAQGWADTGDGMEEKVNVLPLSDEMIASIKAEGFPLFAVEPERRDVRRIEKYRKRAVNQGERTRVGRRPNPLASTSEDPAVRAFSRAVRERRFETGGAMPRPRSQAEERAQRELAADRAGVEASLIAKVDAGDALNEWETRAASILRNEYVQDWLLSGEKAGTEAYLKAVKFEWGTYEAARAETARTLATQRDALTAMDRLAKALATPSSETIQKVKKAKTPAEADAALRGEAKDVERARRWLREAGFPPETITRDYLDDPIVLGRILRIISTAKSTYWDWVSEWMITSMLGGPATQVANFTGNAAMQAYDQHAKRLAATLANVAVRSKDGPTFGETKAFYGAWIRGALAGARNFVLAWRTGLPVFDVQLMQGGGRLGKYTPKLDALHGPKIPGVVGTIARAPSTQMLLAVDEFFKTLTATTEATALAYRYAKQEGLKGNALEQRINAILADPSHEAWAKAFQEAKRVTFQDEDSVLTQATLKIRKWADSPWSDLARVRIAGRAVGAAPLGTALFPFVRTPVAIFKYGLGIPLHPLKALYTVPKAIAKGDRATVLNDGVAATISLGIALAVLHMVWSPDDNDDGLPLITGSGGDKASRSLRDRTVPDYSLRVGDTWYSYRRVDPTAVTIATLVDLADEMTRLMRGGEDVAATDALGRLIASVVDQAADKTFLRTFGDLYQAVVERESKSLGPRLVRDQALRMVPNIVRQPLGKADEFVRQKQIRTYEDRGQWEAAAASLPYYAFPAANNAPPPSYDLLGKPIERGDARAPYLWRVLSPVPETQSLGKIHPVYRTIVAWNAKVEDGLAGPDAKPFIPKPPDYWYTIGGETLYWSNSEWERLQRESGEEAEKMLAHRRLNFSDPTQRDVDILSDAFALARKRVRQRLIRERKSST